MSDREEYRIAKLVQALTKAEAENKDLRYLRDELFLRLNNTKAELARESTSANYWYSIALGQKAGPALEVAALRKLVEAVDVDVGVEYDGIICKDIDGVNWFDARDALAQKPSDGAS